MGQGAIKSNRRRERQIQKISDIIGRPINDEDRHRISWRWRNGREVAECRGLLADEFFKALRRAAREIHARRLAGVAGVLALYVLGLGV